MANAGMEKEMVKLDGGGWVCCVELSDSTIYY